MSCAAHPIGFIVCFSPVLRLALRDGGKRDFYLLVVLHGESKLEWQGSRIGVLPKGGI